MGVPMALNNEGLWKTLGSLWDRATGGSDVAARPDRTVDDVWPSATRPPGVAAALDWLGSETPSAVSRILLLVGGPGAGKSHATAAAVRGMTMTSTPEPGLAHRVYEYRDGRRKLLVVNDATISDSRDGTPLVSDINGALFPTANGSLRTDVMACINRGVLIEELSLLGSDPRASETAGALVVAWLARDDTSFGEFTLESRSVLQYARSANLNHNGRPLAHLVVIFVDECSLFEASPELEIVEDRIRERTDYRIRRLAERASLTAGNSHIPAADLLVGVLDTIDASWTNQTPTSGGLVDPLLANVECLKSSIVRSSLLTLARSAELASSSRMTYRELWGFIARALVGNAPERLPKDRLGHFILENQPQNTDALEDFQAIMRLSSLRLTQGIFGAGEDSRSPEGAGRDPVLRIMVVVDPILDALPGNAPNDPRKGWADPVHEAFASQASGSSPLASLVKAIRTEGGAYDHFIEIVSDFDWSVDRAYMAVMADDSLGDSIRHKVCSWYGAYLTRLYAAGLGIPAFRREVDALIEAMVSAPHLPDVLLKPLKTLIRPRRRLRDGESEALLPLFDSRTEPIVGHLVEPKIAVRVEEPSLKTEARGSEQVFLQLWREAELQGQINIDFALVREALSCVEDQTGVTNLVDVTAPRLERVRSSRLRSDLLKGAEVRIASGTESQLLTLRNY